MSEYPGSPEELIRARFAWLRAGDFGAIYRSYHPQARFREHFPSEEEYLSFADEQRLAAIELLELQVIDTLERGNLAKVLSRQVYRVDGSEHHYLEVTTLRLHGEGWHVLFGRRVECAMSISVDEVRWETVEQHPEAIVY